MSEADVMRRLVAGELYVEAWGVRDAPALLYLHGGPGQGCYEFVEHQAARLSDKIRVVALDQRGVLRSAALPPQGMLTIADLIADCETVRTHLEIENWTVLQDTRQRIADMLVAAPFTADQWGKGGDHLARLTQDDDFYQDHTPLLQQVQQPAVLIKGERDPIPSAEEVCDFRHALPHAEVRTYHCGHFVQAEKQLEYTRLVSDFVLGHGKRPKSQTLPSRTS